MARARNLKPGFFRDAKVVSCSFQARLLFQGLWCMADYMGRLKYSPMEVKMEIFPADDVDVPACMEELRNTGLIEMYHDCSGAALVQVVNFTKHQNPHINERQDRNKNPIPCLPGPDDIKRGTSVDGDKKPSLEQRVKDALVVLREYSESDPADSLNLIPDSLLLNPYTPPPADGADEPRDSDSGKSGKSITAKALVADYGIPDQVAADYLKVRKAKRAPLTPTALAGLERECGKAGITLADGMRICAERGWQGLSADWLRDRGQSRGATTAKETPYERGQRMARERGIIQ